MTLKPEKYPAQAVEDVIVTVRGQKVILDRDLAALYGVPTFRFNEAVKRNRRRFPNDFMFQLTADELASLTSQSAMSKPRRGGRRTRPYAFTEHGAVMAANILRSEQAVQMSVFVVRAFVRMRAMLVAQRDLAGRLADLEKKLTTRLDTHETAIVDVLRQIMLLLNPPDEPEPPPKQIGFHPPASPPKASIKRSHKRG
ncbi:MAG: ORF6N domain-containing protein [Planctomycetota bacterium]